MPSSPSTPASPPDPHPVPPPAALPAPAGPAGCANTRTGTHELLFQGKLHTRARVLHAPAYCMQSDCPQCHVPLLLLRHADAQLLCLLNCTKHNCTRHSPLHSCPLVGLDNEGQAWGKRCSLDLFDPLKATPRMLNPLYPTLPIVLA
eukprot:1159474-Pelagomonas_calceolata.AAC.2